MSRNVCLYLIIVGHCSAIPAPSPQFPPLFGGGVNNTNPGGNNNGSTSPNPGFFSGLGGLVNNFMSSLWGFLPIPGRPNASSQPPPIPDSVIANTPPGMMPIAIPIGPVTNGAGGSPTLLPPQPSGSTFDANAILHMLQLQQQPTQLQQQPSSVQYPVQPFPQGLPQNSITIPAPGGTYQVISQSPTAAQNAGSFQILGQQSQPGQSSGPLTTIQVVGPPQPQAQPTNPVTYQVVNSPQPQTMQQTLPQTILLPPPRKK